VLVFSGTPVADRSGPGVLDHRPPVAQQIQQNHLVQLAARHSLGLGVAGVQVAHWILQNTLRLQQNRGDSLVAHQHEFLRTLVHLLRVNRRLQLLIRIVHYLLLFLYFGSSLYQV